MGRAIAAAPLLAVPVAVYNLLVWLLAGGFTSTAAQATLSAPLFELRTAPGGVWPVSIADLLLASALIVLFLELVKSSHDRRAALINHALNIVLFIICLAQMLLAAACATSTFFLITLMVLLDVLAGFILTLATARRQVDRGE